MYYVLSSEGPCSEGGSTVRISLCPPSSVLQASQLFGVLVDVWSARMDSVANLQCRKLTGLAMANLLPVADACVTSRFETLVNTCVEVMHDVMETSDDSNELFE